MAAGRESLGRENRRMAESRHEWRPFLRERYYSISGAICRFSGVSFSTLLIGPRGARLLDPAKSRHLVASSDALVRPDSNVPKMLGRSTPQQGSIRAWRSQKTAR